MASPLLMHLLESWLLHWAHGYYLAWQGSTLEELPVQEYVHNYHQWRAMCDGNFALPFDFENFDHQLWMHEVITLLKIRHDIAIFNAPSSIRLALKLASKTVLRSIENATLRYPHRHGDHT